MAVKTATANITRRLRSAKPTSQSIIEKQRTFDDHAVAGIQAFLNDDLIALLAPRPDLPRLEPPLTSLEEDAIGIPLEHERSRRHDRHGLSWSDDGYIGKHPGLQSVVRVRKCNSNLRATRIRVDHIADEQHMAFESLVGIGGKIDVDRLIRSNK